MPPIRVLCYDNLDKSPYRANFFDNDHLTCKKHNITHRNAHEFRSEIWEICHDLKYVFLYSIYYNNARSSGFIVTIFSNYSSSIRIWYVHLNTFVTFFKAWSNMMWLRLTLDFLSSAYVIGISRKRKILIKTHAFSDY